MRFSEESLIALHNSVREQMSEYRFIHTAEVEKMAVRLGNLYAPDKLDILRAAALLHDITKEYGIDAHAELIERGRESLSALDRLSYKTLHARSAVELIKEKYGDFAYSEVLDAVRYHTTGRADMSVCNDLHSVHIRQTQIQKHNIRLLGGCCCNGGFTVGCGYVSIVIGF